MNPGSPYRPGREIARGGMGAVLDARDQKFGRSVAMKVMLRRSASEEEQQRFLQEARVLGQLAHPNIVPVHDLGADAQGRQFYTMKLVQGVTLHDVIGKLKAGDQDTVAKYPLNALLTIFQKVCDAVGFAHARGVMHRDLKPQNIMVGEFGEVLVMDWGLAKILPGSAAAEEAGKSVSLRGALGQTGPLGTLPVDSAVAADDVTLVSGGASSVDEVTVATGTGGVAEPQLVFGVPEPEPTAASGSYATLEGAVMGTPHYMSPEQAEGRISDLDARSDIYSLGGILYALLTLRPPIEGNSLETILARVRRGSIKPPTDFNAPPAAPAAPANAPGAGPQPSHALPHCPDGKVPAALSAVTMKALARDKSQRYPTVTELTQDVVAYQGGFATSAENADALTLVRLFIRRNKVLASAAALVLLVILIALPLVLASERKARANALAAEESARVARQHEAEAKVATAAAVKGQAAARLSATQAHLALAEAAQREGNGLEMQAALGEVPEELRDSTWHYLLAQADTSVARLRTATSQEIASVAADPLRPAVFAVADGSGRITVLNALTGVRQLEFNPGLKQVRGGLRLAFSPDGTRLALGRTGTEGGIAIHSAKDGAKLAEWAAPSTKQLEFSPDGQSLLQVEARGSAITPRGVALKVWHATTGKLRWEQSDVALAAFTPDGQQVLTHHTAASKF